MSSGNDFQAVITTKQFDVYKRFTHVSVCYLLTVLYAKEPSQLIDINYLSFNHFSDIPTVGSMSRSII